MTDPETGQSTVITGPIGVRCVLVRPGVPRTGERQSEAWRCRRAHAPIPHSPRATLGRLRLGAALNPGEFRWSQNRFSLSCGAHRIIRESAEPHGLDPICWAPVSWCLRVTTRTITPTTTRAAAAILRGSVSEVRMTLLRRPGRVKGERVPPVYSASGRERGTPDRARPPGGGAGRTRSAVASSNRTRSLVNLDRVQNGREL